MAIVYQNIRNYSSQASHVFLNVCFVWQRTAQDSIISRMRQKKKEMAQKGERLIFRTDRAGRRSDGVVGDELRIHIWPHDFVKVRFHLLSSSSLHALYKWSNLMGRVVSMTLMGELFCSMKRNQGSFRAALNTGVETQLARIIFVVFMTLEF